MRILKLSGNDLGIGIGFCVGGGSLGYRAANERRFSRPNADQREANHATTPGPPRRIGVRYRKEGVDGATRHPRERTKVVCGECVCWGRILAKSRRFIDGSPQRPAKIGIFSRRKSDRSRRARVQTR